MKNRKCSNTWGLNNTLLNDGWVIKEISKEIKKSLESNENENIPYQNLWEKSKAMQRGMFIPISVYIKKQSSQN
jgi:hypothetical protein